MDWKTRELDAAYLLDSGLLFEINRGMLHQLGIALTVKKDAEGKLVLNFKDCREAPEELVFSKQVYENGPYKLRRFCRDFGYDQIKKRDKKLGWSTQSWFVPENRRYRETQ